MPQLPFMHYPFPRVPDQALKPLNPPPPPYTGSRIGTLGPSLHIPGTQNPVSDPIEAKPESETALEVTVDQSEKWKLIDYCVSAGIPIDKRWGIAKINAAISSHGNK